jgi:hypothetical protein
MSLCNTLMEEKAPKNVAFSKQTRSLVSQEQAK